MITKEYQDFLLICDICGKPHEAVFSSWEKAKDAKKEDGWTSNKVDGEWIDICPDCRKEDEEIV